MIITFFSSLPTAIAVAVVASSVVDVRATSSNGMTATGLKKWNPTTRSGFFNPCVIASTDREEVFVANTHSGETISSSFLNSSCFSESSSKMASMTKSQLAKTFWSADPEIKRARRAADSALIRFFSTNLSSSFLTQATPLSARAWSMSVMTTGHLRFLNKSRAN
ncbi:unannotated protein [freshwater metagenome]|uniref:Unannotated protein n=1 Tax=freshwater metagenome TaxID=449393 RepID=A0A6J6DP33_9ZZZZ